MDAYRLTALATACCAKYKRWQEAVNVLSDMRASGAAPDTITYSAALTACRAGGAAGIAAGFAEWQTMLDSGLQPDAHCYAALFRLCSNEEVDCWQQAAAAWHQLQKERVTFQQQQEARQQQQQQQQRPQPLLYHAKCEAAFIRACRAAPRKPEALQQLLLLLETGCLASNASYARSVALALSSIQGNWSTALQLLQDMRRCGHVFRSVYSTVTTAAATIEQQSLQREVLAALEACCVAAATIEQQSLQREVLAALEACAIAADAAAAAGDEQP
jgi:pentatricopeptide repeat protein